MDVSLQFLGAARSVTGSKYLLTFNRERVLVDCGLFQGKKELRLRNWSALPVEPASLQCVVITHAHIDHIGYLPRLVKDGFRGPIFCTRPTADLLKIMLRDAARLQEEEALFAFRQGYSKHAVPQPLFTEADAEAVFHYVRAFDFAQPVDILSQVSLQFLMAGHILGAAQVEFTVRSQPEKIILFSGDLGRSDDPILYPPVLRPRADVLIVESTYGDRSNPTTSVEEDLAHIIREAMAREGTVILPAFAVGRTQSLIYYLLQLMRDRKIPPLPIFIDSPMAIHVTALYEQHAYAHQLPVRREGRDLKSLFDSPNIHYCATADQSKALNNLKRSALIVSASGMVTGGRVLHHLFHRLGRQDDTVLFTGYQAEGTRGRMIQEGQPSVRIFGREVPVQCQVRTLQGMSAHADREELLRWLSGFADKPKYTFITHGEIAAAEALARELRQSRQWEPIIPEYLQSFSLFTGL